MIEFKKLPFDVTDVDAVSDVILSGSVGQGKVVRQLEEKFAEYVGAKYAVAVNSCTAALFLCLKYPTNYRLVAIPSMLVPLVANEIIHAGYEPYFIADTAWVGGSYRLGNTCIVDSAHEVKYRDDFDKFCVCYSFYPTKPLGGVDGGMICTDDSTLCQWYREARDFGKSDSAGNSWDRQQKFIGWRFTMSDVQATVVLNRLKHFGYELDKMASVRRQYNAAFGLENTSDYLYRIDVPERDSFIEEARDKGIICGIHYHPLHHMPLYSSYGMDDMSEVDDAYATTVSLPFHSSLTMADIAYIIEFVNVWRNKHEHSGTAPGA